MLRFIALLFAVFCSTMLTAQTKKTAHKAIIVQDIELLVLQLDAHDTQVEVLPTKGSRVLVETTIEMDVANPALLEFVMESGRYELTEKVAEERQALTLIAPERSNVIISKGKEVSELIHYKIYVPERLSSAVVDKPQTAMSAPPSKD